MFNEYQIFPYSALTYLPLLAQIKLQEPRGAYFISKTFLSIEGHAGVLPVPKQSELSIYEIIGSRRPDLVRGLIERGLFVPDPDDIGNFPVHTAIATGDDFILKEFINYFGSKLKLYKNFLGKNALHFAARIGSSVSVSILLNNEFEVNERTDDGRTSMMLACTSGSLPTIKALASDRELDYTMTDINGRTCWHYAIDDFILRKNCSRYISLDCYGSWKVAYLINLETFEILKFLSRYATYAMGIKGDDVDFPCDIPLDILKIEGISQIFRDMEKIYGVRFNHSDRKVASPSKTEKVEVVFDDKIQAVLDASCSAESCLAGEYDDTGSPTCVIC